MMHTLTISQVSKNLGVSTRMIRYYEKLGLIKSNRIEGYAYRIYDEDAVLKMEQILLLRKLRIPVRQIQVILENKNAVTAINIFRQNLNELHEEMTALSTIKVVLSSFIKELVKATDLPLEHLLLKNESLYNSIESLDIVNINFKEEQTLDKLNQAEKELSKVKDARILYLPPVTIAAAHYIGDEPEAHVNALIEAFVKENQLTKIKPDLRRYGFNHPNPIDETNFHGYEAWVTIPEDMTVPAPLIKKQFLGGTYAAHMITFGNFDEWDAFLTWIGNNEQYEFAGNLQDQEHMCGLLEEHLNYYSFIESQNNEEKDIQLDLLMPVRRKERGV